MEGLIFGILQYLLFENTRKKNLKLNLVLEVVLSSFSNPERFLLLHRYKRSYKTVPGATTPAPTPFYNLSWKAQKQFFSGVVQSQWPNQESGGKEGGRGSPDALNASIMQTRDVFSNWENKYHVNKIVYCIAGWHIGIYENKVY